MRATGNTILVTGGTSGIGLALARSLADGNTVIVCGRDAARLEAARAAVPGLAAIGADVADPAGRAVPVIGMSRVAGVLARVAPGIAFAAMNRREARDARDGR